DCLEVGRHVGQLAADVLDGKNTANIPVENFMPEVFLFNETVLATLKDRWTIPDSLRQRAHGWITATATNLPSSAPKAPTFKAVPGRVYSIGLAYFAPEAGCDSCIKGILDGLRELGFEEGRNLKVRRGCRQVLHEPSAARDGHRLLSARAGHGGFHQGDFARGEIHRHNLQRLRSQLRESRDGRARIVWRGGIDPG